MMELLLSVLVSGVIGSIIGVIYFLKVVKPRIDEYFRSLDDHPEELE